MYSNCHTAWNWRLFENWGEFFSLAIAGVFMKSLEVWAFEISVFMAGEKKETRSTTLTIRLQVSSDLSS
jgi:hypothetical protein